VAAAALLPAQPPDLASLTRLGEEALTAAGCASDYLGFAMVCVSNAFWREHFAAVPFSRRLLLLPHCLRHPDDCRGRYDGSGLHCSACGSCHIDGILREARTLGYRTMVAEGTPAVLKVLMAGEIEAVLGVACLESLEQAFRHVRQIGIPHLAVPLLQDGCRDTAADLPAVSEYLRRSRGQPGVRTRSYLPLLRVADAVFGPPTLPRLFSAAGFASDDDPRDPTAEIAVDWLCQGGKRFRPFMMLATHAAFVLGPDALDPARDLLPAFSEGPLMIAVGLEALHKASLAHDDIADDDQYRYGREALHRRHGVPLALNVGDLLVGLGYRLVVAATRDVGAAPVNQLLARLAAAHLLLCRGQGTEIALTAEPAAGLDPLAVLRIYAEKTAPAFAVTLHAGACTAGCGDEFADLFKSFSRALGVAYQIRNDLDDWREYSHDKRVAGQDCLARRPTILRAFALQAMGHARESEVLDCARGLTEDRARLLLLRQFYQDSGAFAKAQELADRYRQRARDLAGRVLHESLRQYLLFLVDLLM
jgi:geranylgeranyl pyrophosphate synthase